jgi:hypothetical protein
MTHDRSFDADVGLPPVARRAAVTRPLLAHARAAREADAPVDDEDAPVIAMVDPLDRQRIDGMVGGHVTARVLHQLPVLLRHAVATDGVQQHVDAHTGTAAPGQSLGHVARDVTFLIDEVGEGDRRLRLADRGEHRRKDLVTVQEDLRAVARHQRRVGMRLERADEGGLANADIR